tara:strand:+ start:450 stop:902 length:453 start_codon:yes stop_codon:yes gene_type:complete
MPTKKQTYLEKYPEMIDRFIQLVEAGVPPTNACNFINIGVSTYFKWMSEGRQKKSKIYIEFRRRVLEAETKCMLKNLLLVQKAASDGKERAAIWMLENRFGHVFKKQPEIEININTNESGKIQELIENLQSTEDLVKLKGPIIDVDEGNS